MIVSLDKTKYGKPNAEVQSLEEWVSDEWISFIQPPEAFTDATDWNDIMLEYGTDEIKAVLNLALSKYIG